MASNTPPGGANANQCCHKCGTLVPTYLKCGDCQVLCFPCTNCDMCFLAKYDTQNKKDEESKREHKDVCNTCADFFSTYSDDTTPFDKFFCNTCVVCIKCGTCPQCEDKRELNKLEYTWGD